MNIRHGIDISNIQRIEKAMKSPGKGFAKRVFTVKERRYCEARKMKYEHFAARFSAKEALMKALEVQAKKGIDFQEIEIRNRPSGKPYIHLSRAVCKRLGLGARYQIELSMAHEREYAIASVIIASSR